MNIKYDGDKIELSFSDLLDHMTLDEKKSLIERLSCENDIIEHVVSQIATGYTENCCSGSRGCGAEIEPHTPLDKARRTLALSAGEVAKKELESALNSLRLQQAWHDHYRDWAFEIYHAWGKQSQCPQRNSPTSGAWNEYEVIKKPKEQNEQTK